MIRIVETEREEIEIIFERFLHYIGVEILLTRKYNYFIYYISFT